MSEFDFREVISTTGYAIESVGVAVIVIGVLIATVRYARHYFTGRRKELYTHYRRDIGRALMVGLEFLVAGDIIRTVVVADSLTDVASLGLIVVIRTVLVFTIHLEVEGHWPWQPAPSPKPQ